MEILDFGTTKKNETAYLYTLKNQYLECQVTDYGTTLVKLSIPDKNNHPTDIVLGFDDVLGYESDSGAYIGCNVGRCANRIAGASFSLNNVVYQLEKNDGENSLHSGFSPYSKRIWKVEDYSDTAITFSLTSPHLDQGFPGNVCFFIRYKLTDNQLDVTFTGTTDQDTIINLTNHSYFNLNGQGNVLDHDVKIYAKYFTPNNANAIPLGYEESVKDTPMDFTSFKKIGHDISKNDTQLIQARGYDHNFCIQGYDGSLLPAASLYSETSGIRMDLWTDYPGIQMYTANFLNNVIGKGNALYQERYGVCLEPQFFPDSIHVPAFVSPITKANTTYEKHIRYEFFVSK